MYEGPVVLHKELESSKARANCCHTCGSRQTLHCCVQTLTLFARWELNLCFQCKGSAWSITTCSAKKDQKTTTAETNKQASMWRIVERLIIWIVYSKADKTLRRKDRAVGFGCFFFVSKEKVIAKKKSNKTSIENNIRNRRNKLQRKRFRTDIKEYFLIWYGYLNIGKIAVGHCGISIGAKHCQEWLDTVDLSAGVRN